MIPKSGTRSEEIMLHQDLDLMTSEAKVIRL